MTLSKAKRRRWTEPHSTWHLSVVPTEAQGVRDLALAGNPYLTTWRNAAESVFADVLVQSHVYETWSRLTSSALQPKKLTSTRAPLDYHTSFKLHSEKSFVHEDVICEASKNLAVGVEAQCKQKPYLEFLAVVKSTVSHLYRLQSQTTSDLLLISSEELDKSTRPEKESKAQSVNMASRNDHQSPTGLKEVQLSSYFSSLSLWDLKCSKELSGENSCSQLHGELVASSDLANRRASAPSLNESWTLDPRLLRRIVALSCPLSSKVRDLITDHCGAVVMTSLDLFYLVALEHAKQDGSQFEAPPDIASKTAPEGKRAKMHESHPSDSHQLLESDELSRQVRFGQPSKSELLRESQAHRRKKAAISESGLLLILDYSLHSVESIKSPSSSDSETREPYMMSTDESDSAAALLEASLDRPLVMREAMTNKYRRSVSMCENYRILKAALDVISGDRALVVLVSGGSGCGKSTLSCLLANRLGLGTVLSTDTVRHILRSIYTQIDQPLLYASTYETDKFITDETFLARLSKDDYCNLFKEPSPTSPHSDTGSIHTHLAPEGAIERRKCLEGYLMQSEMLYDRLEFIITQWLVKGESLVVEGVHLTPDFVKRILQKFPKQCVPFVVYVSNEYTHVDRFANRSRNFDLNPKKNKYIGNLENIRTIQRYLKQKSSTLCSSRPQGIGNNSSTLSPVITQVDNTSVSSAIRTMHTAVVSHLKSNSAA